MRLNLILLLVLFALALANSASAASPCPRPHTGGVVAQPEDLYSSNGVLNVEVSFQSSTGIFGRSLYCYIVGGSEAPTLRVKAGDEVVLKLRNDLPAGAAASHRSDACTTTWRFTALAAVAM